jgi:hypothetical protein
MDERVEDGPGYRAVFVNKPIPSDAVRIGWTATGEFMVGVGVYFLGIRLFEIRRTMDRPKTRGLFNYLLARLFADEPEKFRDLRDWLNENVKD